MYIAVKYLLIENMKNCFIRHDRAGIKNTKDLECFKWTVLAATAAVAAASVAATSFKT